MVDELAPAVNPIGEVAGVWEGRGVVAQRIADNARAWASGSCRCRQSIAVGCWCESHEVCIGDAPGLVEWVVEFPIQRGHGILCRSRLDKLMLAESELKRVRFALLVRLKALLTPLQQQKLEELKRRQRPDDAERRPPPRDGEP